MSRASFSSAGENHAHSSIRRYGNNYANLGSASKTTAGRYLVRYAPAGQEPGVQQCHQDCHGYSGFINAPTLYGTYLARFLVKNNGSDLKRVHEIQNQTALFPIPVSDGPKAPALTVDMLNGSLPQDHVSRIMELTARIHPYNMPRNISNLLHVDRMLHVAGIRNGHYEPRTQNLTAVAQRAVQSVQVVVSKPENGVDLENGWRGLNPSVQGDYGIAYQMRAYVCWFGYLALTASEALYPSYYSPDTHNAELNLRANEAFVITFGSRPQLIADGFWSLTAYNAQQYLIDNPIDRYEVGDRSPLTYPDGTLVYGGKWDKEDRPFQLLVQPSDVRPPKNWSSK